MLAAPARAWSVLISPVWHRAAPATTTKASESSAPIVRPRNGMQGFSGARSLPPLCQASKILNQIWMRHKRRGSSALTTGAAPPPHAQGVVERVARVPSRRGDAPRLSEKATASDKSGTRRTRRGTLSQRQTQRWVSTRVARPCAAAALTVRGPVCSDDCQGGE